MTKTNALIGGIVLAAALAAANILFNNTQAQAGAVSDAVSAQDIIINGVEIKFLADAGCTLRAVSHHAPQPGDLEVNVTASEYAFNGARCGVLQNAAAKAVVLDFRKDGGVP